MNILWFGPPVPAKSDHARQSNDATRLGTVGHMNNRRRNTSQTATFVRIGGQEAGGLLLGAKGAGAAAGSWILLVALLVACLFFNWLAILPVLILIGGAIIVAGRHTWASILAIMLLALLGFSSGLFFWWSYYVRIDAARTNEPAPSPPIGTWSALQSLGHASQACMALASGAAAESSSTTAYRNNAFIRSHIRV